MKFKKKNLCLYCRLYSRRKILKDLEITWKKISHCTIYLFFRELCHFLLYFSGFFVTRAKKKILYLLPILIYTISFFIFSLDRLIVSKTSFSLALLSSFAYLAYSLGKERIPLRIHILPNSVHGEENEPRKFPKISNPCLQELTNCSKSCLIRTQKDVFGSMNCPKWPETTWNG